MTPTVDAWERIKLYAYQHAHPDDTERIRADVEEIEGLLDGRPVTAGTARTPVQGIDRDQLDRFIRSNPPRELLWDDEGTKRYIVDGVLALVRPAEPMVLDREQAKHVLYWHSFKDRHDAGRLQEALDRLEACVRPVGGVVLTPEEAARVAVWGRAAADTIRAFGPFVVMAGVTPEWCEALAARLEASS